MSKKIKEGSKEHIEALKFRLAYLTSGASDARLAFPVQTATVGGKIADEMGKIMRMKASDVNVPEFAVGPFATACVAEAIFIFCANWGAMNFNRGLEDGVANREAFDKDEAFAHATLESMIRVNLAALLELAAKACDAYTSHPQSMRNMIAAHTTKPDGAPIN